MPVIPAPSSHGRRATNRDVQHKPSPTASSPSENPDIIREKALGSPEPRMPAWDVLELEYPHHLQCYYCRDLHPLADIKSYNYRGHARCSRCLLAQCHKLNCRFRTKTYIHPDFSLTTFRMIMKQHRQGKDCNVLLKLLAYRSGVTTEGPLVKRLIVTPKIVDGKLFMRSQTVNVLPTKKTSRIYHFYENRVKCPHTDRFSPGTMEVGTQLSKGFEALDNQRDDSQHVTTHQCKFCPTEFDFRLQRFEGQGAVLIITKWQDFGPGLSPLDSDLPPVIGSRRVRRDIEEGRGKEITYESLRTKFKGTAPSGKPSSIPDLGFEERKELFKKFNSRPGWVGVVDNFLSHLEGFGGMQPGVSKLGQGNLTNNETMEGLKCPTRGRTFDSLDQSWFANYGNRACVKLHPWKLPGLHLQLLPKLTFLALGNARFSSQAHMNLSEDVGH